MPNAPRTAAAPHAITHHHLPGSEPSLDRRADLSLDGTWSIVPDLEPHNPNDSPASPREGSGLHQNWAGQPDQVPGWQPIRVPAAWQSVFGEDAIATKEAGWVDGLAIAWYRRRLELPADFHSSHPSARYFLRFEAAATDTRAFIDGHEVGRSSGDWMPFEFDVTAALAGKSAADLVVRVDKVPAPPQVMVDGVPVQNGHLTKGFHDLLSCHHGGLWQSVSLRRRGLISLIPDGLTLVTDGSGGHVTIDLEFARCETAGHADFIILDPSGKVAAKARLDFAPASATAQLKLQLDHPRLWWPEDPALYTLEATLHDTQGPSDSVRLRFGFRTVTAHTGADRTLNLNGRPILLKGPLDWGHEKDTWAPARSKAEYVARFKKLKALGFNCLCICMWYPPPAYYEAADEVGLMLWQEHPIWKSDMRDQRLPEYIEQCTRFFRRDRNHPSVVLVSGSCEHERFNPNLADWWWKQARSLMPDRALQVQTAFLAWTDLTKSDLYDEHTYDSAGRWVTYLRDLNTEMDALAQNPAKGPKPFIMGEAVLYTSWPDAPALVRAASNLRDKHRRQKWPWWFPKGFDSVLAFDADTKARFGAATLSRFKSQGDRFNLRGRKFQFERFRDYHNHAGLVMNHYNDVNGCRCGFVDDLDRWRFAPDDTRGWAADAALLLRTPGYLSAYTSGQWLPCDLALSNFGPAPAIGSVALSINEEPAALAHFPAPGAPQGRVTSAAVSLSIPTVTTPTRLHVVATPHLNLPASATAPNFWDIWALPAVAPLPDGTYRLDAPARDARYLKPDFEENKYSSGWGLRVRTWSLLSADPAALVPRATPLPFNASVPPDCRVLVATRWSQAVLHYLTAGGRVLFLPVKGEATIPTKFINLWGQDPLIIESTDRSGPFTPGDSAWILDTLDYDLNRNSTRAVPTDEIAGDISHQIAPIVRLVYTHDMQDRIRPFDQVFSAAVGAGLLCVSTLDHSQPAGRYFLSRLLTWLADPAATSPGRLAPETCALFLTTSCAPTPPPAGFAMATE